jgi:hypothetical protein
MKNKQEAQLPEESLVEDFDEETLQEDADKPYNGDSAASDVAAIIRKSASKTQPKRKGDLNAKDIPAGMEGGPHLKEEAEDEEVQKKFKEDLDALVSSEATLSESFREKASVIFEAALASKIASEVNRLEEQYEEQLNEEIEQIESHLVEKVDSYLSYVVETWMKENELAVESGLRSEIAESFIASLQTVFAEHYLEVPQGKEDLVETLTSRVEELEESLNDIIGDNVSLKEQVSQMGREKLIRESSVGLSETQIEKLKTLTEGLEFDSSDSFAKKVETIKESYFSSKKVISEETQVSGEPEEQVEMSPMMSRYLEALKK